LNDLDGKRILITSGPTRGPIDAVRYITNKSTGRLGMLLAVEALSRGAEVTFVHGKGSRIPGAEQVGADALSRLSLREIETVDELLAVMKEEMTERRYDAVLHSMAVLDYAPDTYIDSKTPSGQNEWWVKLRRTPKVIKVVKELQPTSLLISFKLEVGKSKDELIEAAHRSLIVNRADLVLANDLLEVEKGHHVGFLVNAAGEAEAVVEGKAEIARVLVDAVAERTKVETS
jgi:phosphopantothenoylcysteine synthetase/decarboxylase